jgi:putative transcriptional regulator
VKTASRRSAPAGLPAIRRSGLVTELLFLYECTTLEPSQLRPVANDLGLTVQAASHTFRQLRERGLVEVREGRYRPTVAGVAWLHESLTHLSEDVRERIERLHVIRSTRAVARSKLRAGDVVSLELRGGLLSAVPGSGGPSRGRAAADAQAGDLVAITDLEGIVPIVPAQVRVRTLSDSDLDDPELTHRLRASLPPDGDLLAADGLEAYHSLRVATDRPIQRFAPAASCLEAARIGVASTVVALERELPQLLSVFAVPNPPALDVAPLPPPPRRRRAPLGRRERRRPR